MARRSRKSTGGEEGGKRKGRLFHRGNEGRERIDDELELQKARREAALKKAGAPLRFFVPVGDTKEFVVLDDAPEYFMYEHALKDPKTGRWGLLIPCIKEWDNCPACEQVSDSTYVMFLSVLDLTSFEDRNGKVHEFSRKLLAVKPAQQKKFIRAHKREGTLRGAIFETSRDGPKDAAIGNDIEFLEFMPEEELENEYIRKWTDRDKKEHTENCSETIDYEDLFEEPSADSIRALVGGEATAGSDRSNRSTLRDRKDNDDGWDKDSKGKEGDEVPWDGEEGEKEEKPERGTRRSRRSRKEAEQEEKPERPSRSSRSSRRSEEKTEEKPERSSRSGRRSSRRSSRD